MIWIRIVSKDGAPASALALGVPLAARFGDSVGDLGRGVGCTLVLPDPNREISRKQALVTCQAGRHFIRPIGTNLDIAINGRLLQPDVETPLDVGAEIRIGPYVMRVERSLADATVPAPVARPPAPPAARPPTMPAAPMASAPRPQVPPPPRAPVPPPPPAAPARNAQQDPLAIFNTPNRPAKGGVFDDLLKASILQPRPAIAPQQPSVRPLPKPPDRDGAPPVAPAQRPTPPVTPAAKADRAERSPAVPPVASPPAASPPVVADNARRDQLPDREARAGAAERNAVPGRGAERGAIPERGVGERGAVPERGGAERGAIPERRAGERGNVPERNAGAERGAAANDDMVRALYGGLGMVVPPPGERSAEKIRLIGELLRESLAGTIELLAARQIAKKNLGVSATMLQTRGNNPLKFSPNVDAALTHLLGPPLRGFIGPRDAVHDALGDLRAHQVAMLAGMRAALEAVLERFDPVALEARLAPKGVMDQLMPLNRRARLWETFGEQYAEILREVEDDWDALFGKAFLQAYERQLAELARAPTVDGDSIS